VPAIDLTYGVVLCFACHDYVYCDEVDTIAQSQRQLTGTSLGMHDTPLEWLNLGTTYFLYIWTIPCAHHLVTNYSRIQVWLSVWSKLQIICIWSSWCHWHPIISCFIKIYIGLTFLVQAYPGCPGKESVKLVSVCCSYFRGKMVNVIRDNASVDFSAVITLYYIVIIS